MLNYITLANKSTSYNTYLKENALDLLDKTFNIPLDFDFDILEVTKEYIARPDLLSYEAYGDDRYADIICKINGISNPFELNEGMILVMPSFSDVNNFMHKPSDSELSNDQSKSEINIPIPKVKNTKRKANEAVIGDNRFKVDKNKRVIIY